MPIKTKQSSKAKGTPASVPTVVPCQRPLHGVWARAPKEVSELPSSPKKSSHKKSSPRKSKTSWAAIVASSTAGEDPEKPTYQQSTAAHALPPAPAVAPPPPPCMKTSSTSSSTALKACPEEQLCLKELVAPTQQQHADTIENFQEVGDANEAGEVEEEVPGNKDETDLDSAPPQFPRDAMLAYFFASSHGTRPAAKHAPPEIQTLIASSMTADGGSTASSSTPSLAASPPASPRALRHAGDVAGVEPGSAKAMDRLLRETFVKAVRCSDGRLAPLKGTVLYVQHMRPSRPPGTSLDVKESSFKSLKGFLKKLEEEGLLSLKPGLADPFVMEINTDHPDLRMHEPSWRDASSAGIQNIKKMEPLRSVKALSSEIALKPQATRLRLTRTILATKSAEEKAPSASCRTSATLTPSTTESDAEHSAAKSEGNAYHVPNGDETLSMPSPSLTSLEQEVVSSDVDLLEPLTPSITDVLDSTDNSAVTSNKASDNDGHMFATCTCPTGDFVVSATWSSCESWGDEVALSVEEGKAVYVKEIDQLGWARAVSESGRNGWMPASILCRKVYRCLAEFSGGPGYLAVQKGNCLVVYHREGEWAYGSRIKLGSNDANAEVAIEYATIESGWFPCSVVSF